MSYSNFTVQNASTIDDNRQLFEYTSGRWIYNEKMRLSERHGVFNVDALKSAAAQSIQRCDADIKYLSKLAEGRFNRVLQLTMVDDTQLLARLPYPSTRPKTLAVASEVATLAFLRAHGLPVPRVHAYSTDAKNPVGSEYIIMEKLSGQPLGDRWFDLSDKQRLKVLLQLVQLEAKLHTIELPASGSIYYSKDLPSDLPRIVIIKLGLSIDRGPNTDAIDALCKPALKELTWLRTYGRPRFPFQRAYRESMEYQLSLPDVHMRSLEAYLKIAPNLLTSVLPLFLAAGIPKFFQNYDNPELLAFRPPPYPDLDGMDEEEKAGALDDSRHRHTHFFYLAFTQRFNEPHFRTMDQPTNMLTRRIFSHAGEPWEGNNIPLQADLVLITKLWHEFSPSPCPISFTSAEANSIMRLQDMQEEVDLDLKRVRNAIGISVNGWTPTDKYEDACSRARQMKVRGLAFLDTEYEREMTARHWPFDDQDEDE
ncbi:kinase-like domain-containing protein [Aspergillus varians]